MTGVVLGVVLSVVLGVVTGAVLGDVIGAGVGTRPCADSLSCSGSGSGSSIFLHPAKTARHTVRKSITINNFFIDSIT